jgi:hypothetical protein
MKPDTTVVSICNKAVVVDNEGLALLRKYGWGKYGGWSVNYSCSYLHRRESFLSKRETIQYKNVSFAKELLGIVDRRRILPVNGNKLDYRLNNLCIIT